MPDIFIAERLYDLPEFFFGNSQVPAKPLDIGVAAFPVIFLNQFKPVLPLHKPLCYSLTDLISNMAESKFDIFDELINDPEIFVKPGKSPKIPDHFRRGFTRFQA